MSSERKVKEGEGEGEVTRGRAEKCVCVGGMGAVSGRVLNNRVDKGFLKRPVHPERGLVGSAKAGFGS